jgi:hypothetical protein
VFACRKHRGAHGLQFGGERSHTCSPARERGYEPASCQPSMSGCERLLLGPNAGGGGGGTMQLYINGAFATTSALSGNVFKQRFGEQDCIPSFWLRKSCGSSV